MKRMSRQDRAAAGFPFGGRYPVRKRGARGAAMRRALRLALMLVLSSLLFYSLWRFDNEYTYGTPQAADGVLTVSQDDWQTVPLRYLRDGWHYYANQLLTPEALEKQPGGYTTVSVGEGTNFALNDAGRSIHGCGSYALTLHLPRTTHTYAVELPAIYSAYRFYADDRLLLSMGRPEKDGFSDLLQGRMVTFEAAGDVTLLLAVGDYSWFSNGLVTPPVFGETLRLNTVRGIRVGLSLMIVTIALMLAFYSFLIGVSTGGRRNNAWLFLLLCLATAVFIGRPVWHGILPLRVQPWSSVELFCGGLAAFLTLCIHNRMCHATRTARTVSEAAAALFALLSLSYGLWAADLTLTLTQLYSYALLCFFGLIAVYQLVTAARAAHFGTEHCTVLLYADIFLVCAFVWTVLLPKYDPIWGGPFLEWGMFGLTAVLGALLWQEIAEGYGSSLVYAEEHRQMKRQLAMQVQYLHQMSSRIEESTRQRQDFRCQLRTLLALAQAGKNEEIETYIRGITAPGEGVPFRRLAESRELDALLQYYYSLALSEKIELRTRIELPAELRFPIVELCGLLGNLFENAVEACMRQASGDRTIFFAGRLDDGQLEFVLDNSFDGCIRRSGEDFLSSKREGHGLGLISVRQTVDRFGGVINLYPDGKTFHAELSLPQQT